jgi:hypothetical protein
MAILQTSSQKMKLLTYVCCLLFVRNVLLPNVVEKDDMNQKLQLRFVPGTYSIARLAADAPIPDWFVGAGMSALVRADDELTLVCLSERIPPEIKPDGPWNCLRSVGPFAFDATGIVKALVTPLSDAGIGVFVLCTFDGEHLLVPQRDTDRAVAALTAAGHDFLGQQEGIGE